MGTGQKSVLAIQCFLFKESNNSKLTSPQVGICFSTQKVDRDERFKGFNTYCETQCHNEIKLFNNLRL